MIAILRAPELSATSKIDRIWIISVSPEPFLYFRRLADHLLQRPALATAHRPRFHNRDRIADLRLAFFVVHHELGRPPLGLAVQPVPHLPLHRDDDALLHLVTDDGADFF